MTAHPLATPGPAPVSYAPERQPRHAPGFRFPGRAGRIPFVLAEALIALWIVGLPLVQLWRLNNRPALVLGGVAAAALILGGLALDPGASRARSVATLVLLTAGLLGAARGPARAPARSSR